MKASDLTLLGLERRGERLALLLGALSLALKLSPPRFEITLRLRRLCLELTVLLTKLIDLCDELLCLIAK